MNHYYIIPKVVDEAAVKAKAKSPSIIHYHRQSEPCNTKCETK